MITNPLHNFKILGDDRGQLIALEEKNEVPFEIKRVFYIYGTREDTPRGKHSHFKTKQLLICVSGTCKVKLDDGNNTHIYTLDKPYIGLFQDKLIWGEMFDFSPNCVLMVLANEFYDESDYIRDYDEFLEEVKNDS